MTVSNITITDGTKWPYIYYPESSSATFTCVGDNHWWIGYPPVKGQPCVCGEVRYQMPRRCKTCGQEVWAGGKEVKPPTIKQCRFCVTYPECRLYASTPKLRTPPRCCPYWRSGGVLPEVYVDATL